MTTHSSMFPWRTPWTEEPRGLLSKGSQRVRHDCATNTFTFFQDVAQDTSLLGKPYPPPPPTPTTTFSDPSTVLSLTQTLSLHKEFYEPPKLH